MAPLENHHLNNVTWYAQHLVTSLSISLEAWGPIDAADLLEQFYTGIIGLNTFNNSSGRSGVLFNPNTAEIKALAGPTGRITANVYTNERGALVTSCSPVSVSCVPLQMTNVAPRGYGLGGNQLSVRDYDVRVVWSRIRA